MKAWHRFVGQLFLVVLVYSGSGPSSTGSKKAAPQGEELVSLFLALRALFITAWCAKQVFQHVGNVHDSIVAASKVPATQTQGWRAFQRGACASVCGCTSQACLIPRRPHTGR